VNAGAAPDAARRGLIGGRKMTFAADAKGQFDHGNQIVNDD
jgi:hypothetical protein